MARSSHRHNNSDANMLRSSDDGILPKTFNNKPCILPQYFDNAMSLDPSLIPLWDRLSSCIAVQWYFLPQFPYFTDTRKSVTKCLPSKHLKHCLCFIRNSFRSSKVFAQNTRQSLVRLSDMWNAQRTFFQSSASTVLVAVTPCVLCLANLDGAWLPDVYRWRGLLR